MKKTLLTMGSIVALAAAPTLAAPGGNGGGNGNGNGGGAGVERGGGMGNGGVGGGMDRSMGNGPPITPPGQTDDARSAAGDIVSQRGQFGRDFAADRRASQANDAQQLRDLADRFQSQSSSRREAALAQAAAARAGRLNSGSGKDIRDALEDDMEAWKTQFRIDRKAWQAQRDQWLTERDGMTAADWAARRAEWFAARDAWIAKQVDWAKNHSGDRTDDDE